jgi:hypothetical protein
MIICSALFGATAMQLAVPLALATFVQFALGVLSYAVVVNAPYQRAVCVDKGVKAISAVRQRFHFALCSLWSLVVGVLRAAAVIAVTHQVGLAGGARTLASLASSGVAVWLVTIAPTVEEALYGQRPLAYIVINSVVNLADCLGAAAAVYFTLNA